MLLSHMQCDPNTLYSKMASFSGKDLAVSHDAVYIMSIFPNMTIADLHGSNTFADSKGTLILPLLIFVTLICHYVYSCSLAFEWNPLWFIHHSFNICKDMALLMHYSLLFLFFLGTIASILVADDLICIPATFLSFPMRVFAMRAHFLFGTRNSKTNYLKTIIFWYCLLQLSVEVSGVETSEGHSSTPPQFQASKIKYASWITAWCGWIALKYPELIDLIQGDEEEPDDEDSDEYKEYWKKNKRVYMNA